MLFQSSPSSLKFDAELPLRVSDTAIVGTRQQLKKMSDYMLLYSRLAVSGAIRVAVKGDDQELLGLANVAHIFTENKTLVLPDMVSLLFQTITFSYKDLESRMLGDMLGTVRPAQQITLNRTLEEEWSNRIVIYNHLAKAIPSFIHFPGVKPRAKTEPYYHMLWFMQPSQRSDNVQASNDAPLTPAEGFLHHLDQHRNETFGYGARLDNGTWMGFMDMCAQHKATLLGLDMDWVTNPGGPYVEWGES